MKEKVLSSQKFLSSSETREQLCNGIILFGSRATHQNMLSSFGLLVGISLPLNTELSLGGSMLTPAVFSVGLLVKQGITFFSSVCLQEEFGGFSFKSAK